ncbi:hypothetical protein CBOM_08009 [Ceraceosorus bombacis]|uniref:Uncharacterized protein n=1 Tax=Ceraceosorus bombacis TaxID=401625 RepID=A0A0N7LAD9_9BASI|nr:hypothetical protein CBOM_08009 [Ceraceosorus bombacis]
MMKIVTIRSPISERCCEKEARSSLCLDGPVHIGGAASGVGDDPHTESMLCQSARDYRIHTAVPAPPFSTTCKPKRKKTPCRSGFAKLSA